jgi:cytochrome c oxidase subunit 2
MISDKTRSDIIRIAIIWVVVSAIVEAMAAYYTDGYAGAASKQGEVTSEAFFFLLWITIPVFILIALVIFYSMLRFRVADDDALPSESQYRSGRAFPWGWVAMSVVLNVLFIIHPGLTGLFSLWSMAAAATDPIEVDVTARQWAWVFAYPDQDLKNAAELVVPVDTPIRFVLHSSDVIHSFWVPAWGIKKAVIPGETRTLVVTPDKLVDTTEDPTARLQCSQICGVGHAEMQAVVRVVSRTDFDQWVEETRAAAAEGGMDMNMPGMEMPGMEMPDGQTMDSDMPEMQMQEPAAEGQEMPDMQMPDGQTMDSDMPGMQMQEPAAEGQDMSGMNMPAEGPADEQMPMDDQMQMNTMPNESQN